ncbi:MAG: hypothetical protein QW500_03635 [Candidatus Micrarchaeia archaeon]
MTQLDELDDILKKYLGIVDLLISFIPYKKAELWKNFFLNPLKIVAEAKNVTVPSILIDLYVVALLGLVISAIFSYLPQLLIQYVVNPVAFIALISLLVVIFALSSAIALISPILSLLYAGFEFILAKLLGGTANFSRHLFASVMPHLGMFIIMLPIYILINLSSALTSIPTVGTACACLLFPLEVVLLFVWVYSIYLKFLALREVHKVSSLKTIIIIVLPLLVVILVVIVLLLILWASLLGLWMSFMPQMAS